MVEIVVFPIKLKHQYHLSQWRECIYGVQSWNKGRLLWKSVFIPIERQISILKLVEREVFLMKQNQEYYLSQWGESDYGAQSWK